MQLTVPTDEYPEKYEWWINELYSLRVEINDNEQPEDLHATIPP